MEPRARDTLPAQALNAWNSGNRNLKEGTHFLPQGSTPLPGRQKCGLVVSPGGEGNGLWGRASASFFPVCSPCPSEIRKSRSPGQLVGGGLASLGSLTALHPLWTSLSPLSPGSPLSQPLGPPFCPLGPRASDCRRAFALTSSAWIGLLMPASSCRPLSSLQRVSRRTTQSRAVPRTSGPPPCRSGPFSAVSPQSLSPSDAVCTGLIYRFVLRWPVLVYSGCCNKMPQTEGLT